MNRLKGKRTHTHSSPNSNGAQRAASPTYVICSYYDEWMKLAVAVAAVTTAAHGDANRPHFTSVYFFFFFFLSFDRNENVTVINSKAIQHGSLNNFYFYATCLLFLFFRERALLCQLWTVRTVCVCVCVLLLARLKYTRNHINLNTNIKFNANFSSV